MAAAAAARKGGALQRFCSSHTIGIPGIRGCLVEDALLQLDPPGSPLHSQDPSCPHTAIALSPLQLQVPSHFIGHVLDLARALQRGEAPSSAGEAHGSAGGGGDSLHGAPRHALSSLRYAEQATLPSTVCVADALLADLEGLQQNQVLVLGAQCRHLVAETCWVQGGEWWLCITHKVSSQAKCVPCWASLACFPLGFTLCLPVAGC